MLWLEQITRLAMPATYRLAPVQRSYCQTEAFALVDRVEGNGRRGAWRVGSRGVSRRSFSGPLFSRRRDGEVSY